MRRRSLRARALLNANKACEEDADCVQTFVGDGVTEYGCTGAVYVNAEADRSRWEELTREYAECYGPSSVCSIEPPPPACVAGRCANALMRQEP